MKVIEMLWFTSSTSLVGIIVVEDEITKERKAFIGPANGVDEQMDTKGILDRGAPLSLGMAERLYRTLSKIEMKPIKPKGREKK